MRRKVVEFIAGLDKKLSGFYVN